jgi:hypothetical protein
MRIARRLLVVALAWTAAFAQAPSTPVFVTVDNVGRAESDLYFGNAVRDAGGTGRIHHRREMMSIDRQAVIRPNRDTLYSSLVTDLDAGPVTITLPDAGTRFRSMQVIDEDHYVVGKVEYGAGSYRPRAAILDGSWKFPEATPL